MNSPVAPRRMPALIPLALVSAFSSIAQVPAFAQSALPNVVVTATRVAQPASDILSDHTTISAEEIAAAGQVSIAELLQKSRGIEISANGGSGNYASVFVRGASNYQSIVLVDGVRIGASSTGGATWAAIPLSQIDHIEIVYGPLSSLYGADAMGGVIQIFSKRGSAFIAPTMSAGVGSFDRRHLDVGIAGSDGAEHALRYALNAAREKSAEFSSAKPASGPYTYNADRDGYKRNSASGSLSLGLASGHELGMNFLHSSLDGQFDAGPSQDDRSVEKLATYSVYTHNRILPNWNSKLQLSRAADKVRTDASYGKGFIDTTQTGLSWQNDVTLGTDLLQVLLEHRKEDVASDQSALERDRSTDSVALAYQLKRGPHLATASVRNDSNSQYGAHTTGSLGYGYRISAALRANASVGTSFRAPSFNELYYPGYGVSANRPEKGKNAEAALIYADGKSQLSATLYRNRITDLLVYAPLCPVEPGTHPYGCAYNVNRADLSGLSLGASSGYRDFTLRGSLDFQDARDDTTDTRLARRSTRHGSVALDYANGKLRTGVESVFSGSRFDDSANLHTLGGYGIVNLYASYAVTADWSVFGRWNNVADKHYELARNYATAGSNLFVGVRYGMK